MSAPLAPTARPLQRLPDTLIPCLLNTSGHLDTHDTTQSQSITKVYNQVLTPARSGMLFIVTPDHCTTDTDLQSKTTSRRRLRSHMLSLVSRTPNNPIGGPWKKINVVIPSRDGYLQQHRYCIRTSTKRLKPYILLQGLKFATSSCNISMWI